MKKVCIKGNEFNTNYHIIYSADKALENGYSVFKVPDGCEERKIKNGVKYANLYKIRIY